MPSLSLAAPDARARQSYTMIAGAVLVATALCQAAGPPVFTAGRAKLVAYDNAPRPIQAPMPQAPGAPPAAAAAPAFAFHAPTPGYPINSPFGLRRLPWEPHGRMHEGVDIAAPAGLPVGATLAGEVIRTGQGGAYGRFVELRHPEGLTSLYAHLGSIRKDLRPGMALKAGESVGLVGNTGRSTGEHLHLEIRAEGRPLNPALFIGKTFASVDDLPLDAAARFSRRVRLAVVSDATMARMMPKVGLVSEVKATKDGRVRGMLPATVPTGDPSPQAFAAALAARDASTVEAMPKPASPSPEPIVQAAAAAPSDLTQAVPSLPAPVRYFGPPAGERQG